MGLDPGIAAERTNQGPLRPRCPRRGSVVPAGRRSTAVVGRAQSIV